MKLRKFITINYKSARNVEVELSSNKVRTLIGVNDCGKSSVLRALKLFFDEKPAVFFESDSTKRSILSNTPLSKDELDSVLTNEGLPVFGSYDKDMVGILCVFEIDKSYTIDDLDDMGISPHLQCAIDKLNVGDPLYLLRMFNASGEKSSYFMLTPDALDNDGGSLELWNQNQASIKAKQAEAGIADSEVENRNSAGALKNVERAFAIYKKIGTTLQWTTYTTLKKDSELFPVFRYLDWNITTEELNQIATDIIKPIIDSKVKSIQAQINTERDKINIEANGALKSIYDKYSTALPASITGINANVNFGLQQSVTELFVEKSTSDKKIHLDDQGDGIKRQIGLGLIKALAEESISDGDETKKFIWCFDEPETHLFPQAQRDLANSLFKLAQSQFQVIVSTHSTLFVDKSSLSDISLMSLKEGYTLIKSTTATEDIYASLGVRNSDFLFYDRFMAVEGATEYGCFNHLYKLIYEHDLSVDGIQLIHLDGKDNASNQERLMAEIFSDFQKQEDITVYVLDKDSARTGDNIVLIGEIADLEDSLSNDVWISLIKDTCNLDIAAEEIDAMRLNISVTDAESKLHKMLSKHIATKKAGDDSIEYLPSKGDLGAAIVKSVNKIEDVPNSIKEAFEKIRAGIS